MADRNIQLQDPVSGENVYPITLTDNIYLPNGTPLMKYLNALPFPLGTLIHSTSILKNAGLHMADGGELMIGGVYDDFCQYVIANPSEFPILYDDEDLTVEGAKTALEKWQETFATYGQCGNYVITDTYIKLPAITKLSGGLVSTEMTKIASMNEAGLPNITGSITIGGAESGYCSGTGAFTKSSASNIYGMGHSQGAGPKFDFNASRSSSIYGKSSKVETEYVKFPYYIVVATVTKTDIEVNIDNIITDLNNINSKIKTNLLWENANPTASFSAQTITLASSDYDYLMVIIKTNVSTGPYVTRFIEKGLDYFLDYASTGTSSGYYIMAQCRTITYVNDTQYTISANTYGRTGGSATDRQDLNVPYKIYGFKRG